MVYIYPGSGRYRGDGEYKWSGPVPGGKHDFLLFLRQDQQAPQQKAAMAETGRYGFTDVRFIAEGREINLAMLETPELANFRANYEGALKDGVSMAWYPAK